MITDQFEALLSELSKFVKIQLKPDRNNACLIRQPPGINVTLQPSGAGTIVYIVVEIGSPGEGRYKENVLREALKANGLPPPRAGLFCYGKAQDMLLLYESIPLEEASAPEVFDLMNTLVQHARTWKESLQRGEVPSFRSYELSFNQPGSSSRSGMFGL